MNEVMEQWVTALRSGEYEQGRGQLEIVDPDSGVSKFCCLGVLCKLAVDSGVPLVRMVQGSGVVEYNSRYDMPPLVVTEWSGLSYGLARKYASMNDGNNEKYVMPRTFAEIADEIESDHRGTA